VFIVYFIVHAAFVHIKLMTMINHGRDRHTDQAMAEALNPPPKKNLVGYTRALFVENFLRPSVFPSFAPSEYVNRPKDFLSGLQ